MEGDGRATVYAGGWSDYRAQRAEGQGERAPAKAAKGSERPKAAAKPAKGEKDGGLSFTERHRLEKLPAEIERLEAEIAKLEQLMADPDLFTREPVKFQKATEALSARQEALAKAEEEWLDLAERDEA
jgi:ATP-binding cassette subfamily F protein uup